MKLKNFRIPDWTAGEMTPAHGQMVLQYMKERAAANKTADAPTVVAYTHGATCVAEAYQSGVLNHDGTKIYMIPYQQSTATVWHYINVNDATVVAYTHGVTCVDGAYIGGVLARNGRIYMIPYGQSTATVWHYIDTDGSVVAYTHGATCVVTAYQGGALAPNGRIYFAPYSQSTATVWHYIDTDRTVVAYTHGATAVARTGYWGCCVAANGRIYLNPNDQYIQTISHYIDTDGTVVAYTHGATTYWRGSALGYNGNIYVARDARYFNPYTGAASTITGPGDTIGVVTGPDGRIYQVPYGDATATQWAYIDIATNTRVLYNSGATASAVADAYRMGVLAPNGRIYLMPYAQATQPVWHYIQTNNTNPLSTNIVTSPYFNKY